MRAHVPSTGLPALLLVLSFTAIAVSPVKRYGRLNVEGNNVVDDSGNAVQLRGMSLFWSQWMGRYWNADVVGWLAEDWKTTIIRAPMAVENGGYLSNQSEMQKVKTVVDAAIAEGIYVIIDWHDHNAHAHLNEAQSFFAEMARVYGSHPNVIYEIYNEPQQVSWSGTVKPYAEAVIAEIRKHDPDNLILVGTPRWCQDVEAAANNPISGTNIAYVLHFYAASHKGSLRRAARNALAKGIGLFVSEWGTCEYTGNGYLDENETRTWLSFMDQHKLSWCNWSIADKAETAAALKGGASTTGGWAAPRLTPSGTLLRLVLREYAEQDSGGGETGTRAFPIAGRPPRPAEPATVLPVARTVAGGIRVRLPAHSPFGSYSVRAADGRLERRGAIRGTGAFKIQNLSQGLWQVRLHGTSGEHVLPGIVVR